jgi:hypothetical protein
MLSFKQFLEEGKEGRTKPSSVVKNTRKHSLKNSNPDSKMARLFLSQMNRIKTTNSPKRERRIETNITNDREINHSGAKHTVFDLENQLRANLSPEGIKRLDAVLLLHDKGPRMGKVHYRNIEAGSFLEDPIKKPQEDEEDLW